MKKDESPRKKSRKTFLSLTANHSGTNLQNIFRQSFSGVANQKGWAIGPRKRVIRCPDMVDTITIII